MQGKKIIHHWLVLNKQYTYNFDWTYHYVVFLVEIKGSINGIGETNTAVETVPCKKKKQHINKNPADRAGKGEVRQKPSCNKSKQRGVHLILK